MTTEAKEVKHHADLIERRLKELIRAFHSYHSALSNAKDEGIGIKYYVSRETKKTFEYTFPVVEYITYHKPITYQIKDLP